MFTKVDVLEVLCISLFIALVSTLCNMHGV